MPPTLVRAIRTAAFGVLTFALLGTLTPLPAGPRLLVGALVAAVYLFASRHQDRNPQVHSSGDGRAG